MLSFLVSQYPYFFFDVGRYTKALSPISAILEVRMFSDPVFSSVSKFHPAIVHFQKLHS
jgi:energy-converting hydrogenase Eha subunit F